MMALPTQRRLRFDADDFELHTWVVPRRFMRPFDELPIVGAPVDVPGPLPDEWLGRSAAALRKCQQSAMRWHNDLTTPTKLTSVPALTTTPTSESVETPTLVPPAPTRSTAALSKTWVPDSGSARRIQDKAELSHEESSDVHVGREHVLETANGDRVVNEHIQLQLDTIGLASSALAVDDCPSVLSVGHLVEDDGFRQVWGPQLGYLLQDPRGLWCRVAVRNRTPG